MLIAINLINLNDFWADPRFTSIKGQGLTTVIIDTGIDLDHPAFGADNNGDGIADKILYQYDFADNDNNASDRNNHGSHISSIFTSVAPDANLIVLKVFSDNGNGSFADLEKALQWVNQNANRYNVASVNLSLGDGNNWITQTSHYGIGDELAAIANQNIIISTAARNSFYQYGSQQGLAYPAMVTLDSGETATGINFGNQQIITNQPPILAINQGLTLNEAATATITNTQLRVNDTDNTANQIIYSLTNLPSKGILNLNGIQLTLNSTFTQADIDNNLLSYTHDGSETTIDSLSFTVSDGAGGAIATTNFNITVNPVNDTPVLTEAIAAQLVGEGQAFNFTIPNTAFADVDAGDSLSYSLASNTILPNGISFDPTTGTFSGTLTNTSAGTYNITVIATDTEGASVSDSFTLTVANLIGTSGNDTLTGTPNSEKLEGLGGNDTISGGEGNDTLDGGTGNDTLSGGLGDDFYTVTSSSDRILENPDEGIDTVTASIK